MQITMYILATLFIMFGITEVVVTVIFLNKSEDLEQKCIKYLRLGGRLCLYGLVSVVLSLVGCIMLSEERTNKPMFIVLCLVFSIICYVFLVYYWLNQSRKLGFIDKVRYRSFMDEYRLHFKGIFVSGFLFMWSVFFWFLFTFTIAGVGI